MIYPACIVPTGVRSGRFPLFGASLVLMFTLLLCAELSMAQRGGGKTVGQIGGKTISLSDLRDFYTQSYPDESADAQTLRDFLPTYLTYRAKVEEGLRLGLDQDSVFLSEMREFTSQAALSHWIENGVRSALLEEFIERKKTERRAFHLLIRLESDATLAEAQQAYDRLMEAREAFLAGARMDSLNSVYSSRVQMRPVGGQLPWIGAGSTVYDFENALYALQPGEISMPVRSQFGYHLIHLQDVRDRRPDRSVSHIFFRRGNQADVDSLVALAVSDLERGASWQEVVESLSQDIASKANGGSLGWVNYSMRFDDALTDLIMGVDPSAPWQGPVVSEFGTHIFRIDSIRTYSSPQMERQELEKELRGLPRSTVSLQDVLQKARAGAYVRENEAALKTFLDALGAQADVPFDSVTLSSEVLALSLVQVLDDAHTAGDFLQWLTMTHPGKTPSQIQTTWIDQFVLGHIESELGEITARSFPDFNASLNQFRDGLLVFRVNEMNVWDPTQVDSSLIRSHYERNRDRFQYGTRSHYALFTARTDSVLALLETGWREGIGFDSLRSAHSGVQILQDSTEVTEGEPWDRLEGLAAGEFSETFTYRNRPSRILLIEILPERGMTFEEAYYRAFSDMQPELEATLEKRLTESFAIRSWPNRIK